MANCQVQSNGTTGKMSSEVAGVILSICQVLGKDTQQVKAMVQFLQLREKLYPSQAEEICCFSELIQKLLELEHIFPNELSLAVEALRHGARREDLASRLANCVAPSADLQRLAIPENEQTVLLDLQNQLKKGYRSKINIYLANSTAPVDVDDIFCPVQLVLNKRQTKTGLKQPLSSYQELFNLEAKTRLMLKGKMTSGKSTLLRKITKDWVNGKLKNYELVIFLFTGELNPDWTLGEAVVRHLLSRDCKISAEQVDSVIRQNKDKVAILFDSYEAGKFADPPADTPSLTSPLLLRDILTYQQLRESFVMIATRLQGAKEICSQESESYRVYQHVEMAGFKPEVMKDFVRQAVDKSEKQKSLLRYLETNNLKAMARTPGFLQMLCAYWNTSQNLPNPHDGLTTLFHKMILGLYKHGSGSNCTSPCRSLTEPVCKFRSIMLSIGKVAFCNLCNGCEVLTLRELKDGKNDANVDSCLKLGLLKCEDPFCLQNPFMCINDEKKRRFDVPPDSQEEEDEAGWDQESTPPLSPSESLVSFHSNHIHCYCAGLYLRELARSNFSSFQKKLKNLMKSVDRLFENKYIYVFLFCYSIMGDEVSKEKELNAKIGRFMLKVMVGVIEGAVERLRKDPNDETEIKVREMQDHFAKLCLHCNYEAQVGSALNEEMGQCFKEGAVTLVGLSEYTTRALQYFLKHSKPRASLSSSPPASKFHLNTLRIICLGKEVNIVCLKEFTKNIPGGMDYFRSLMAENMRSDPEELQKLLEANKKEFPEVEYADDLCDVKKVSLLDFYRHISKWNPHTNVMLPGIEAVIEYQAANLRELRLVAQGTQPEVWKKLFEAFRAKKFTSLEILDLSMNLLTVRQQRMLYPCFSPSKGMLPCLRELVLGGVQCSSDFVRNLTHLSNLERLGLQSCGLTEALMTNLIESVGNMKNLKMLDLRRNDFSDQTASQFEGVLRTLKLEELKLSLNKVDRSIPKLLNCIKGQKTLRVLHLNHCPHPWDLVPACKDLPADLQNLEDLRLSASLPSFKTKEPPKLPKIKLAEETIATFQRQLQTLTKLKKFGFLYCELNANQFFKLYNACQYLKTNHSLEVMRYSYSALHSERMKNRQLSRILSEEEGGTFLQLW